VVSVSGVDVSFTRMARELLAGDSATFGIRASILTLVPNTLQATRALIAGMDASQRAEVSPDWLARVDSGTADAWTLGYTMVLQGSDASIGMCGFKGPPGADAAVEIAYGVSPEHEGKGYATDAAMWLLAHAFDGGGVFVVRAHTLSNEGASTRVLVKCGFRCMGRVVQPDDGAVWRWEKERSQVLRSAQDS
jgi:RimJ/RimL family protein N-acetyltransferase